MNDPATTGEKMLATAAVLVEQHNALTFAREHLKTHIAWRDFLRAGGELPHEKVGDLEHQEQAIRELDTICKVLRAAVAYREVLQWAADAACATDQMTDDDWALGFIQRLAAVGVSPTPAESR